MGRPLFFLRAYNDLDHLSPIIWKFAGEGERPVVIVTTSLDYEDDYRVRQIRAAGEVEFHRVLDREFEWYHRRASNAPWTRLRRLLYARRRDPDTTLGRRHRAGTFDCSEEIELLRDQGIDRCVFEWGTPYARGAVIERFFVAAKGMGLPTFSLPHGCNIYTRADVNEGYRESVRRGRIPDSTHRNLYDYYVFQNPIRRDLMVRWGYDPVKTQAWGSVRFDPGWQRRNLEHCPPFQPGKDPGDRVRVVFMHHQRNYNLHIDRIWRLLNRLASESSLQLVVKGSTREGSDYESRAFLDRHGDASNVEIISSPDVHSPALIDWADCVINFGSSIGMEVLLQDKPLIVPTHLHDNPTLFEHFGAGVIATSDEEVLDAVLAGRTSLRNPRQESVDAIFREVVYGGREPHDVVQAYYDRIRADRLTY